MRSISRTVLCRTARPSSVAMAVKLAAIRSSRATTSSSLVISCQPTIWCFFARAARALRVKARSEVTVMWRSLRPNGLGLEQRTGSASARSTGRHRGNKGAAGRSDLSDRTRWPKTGSANHLRIPDLRNDQAAEPSRLTTAGSPAAVRASIVRNERFGPSDHARRDTTSLSGLRP